MSDYDRTTLGQKGLLSLTDKGNAELGAQGARYNAGKLRWRNFPLFLIEPLIAVGAAAEKHKGNPAGKYETWNFLKGLSVEDCIDCALRHLTEATRPGGNDLDQEFSAKGKEVYHLAQVAWNCLVAIHYIKTRPELDDRCKIKLKENE